MTGGEKQDIYNLLKKASSWAYGYVPSSFNGETPSFSDDLIAADEIPAVQNAVPAQQNAPVAQNAAPTQQNTSSVHNTAPTQQNAVPDQSASQTQILQNNMIVSEKLTAISTKVLTCHNCVLCQQRKNAVPGEGVVNPVVMVIGEGPGEDEDLQGRPFVGKAGQLLDKMLAAIELDRTVNCYIANIVKCRPPLNRTPMPDEAQACKGYLEAQIHALKPKMILAMGRTAVQNLLQTNQGINSLRGKFFDYHLGANDKTPAIPLLATYHPSALLRDEALKRPAWEDLKVFRARLSQIAPYYNVPFQEKYK